MRRGERSDSRRNVAKRSGEGRRDIVTDVSRGKERSQGEQSKVCRKERKEEKRDSRRCVEIRGTDFGSKLAEWIVAGVLKLAERIGACVTKGEERGTEG